MELFKIFGTIALKSQGAQAEIDKIDQKGKGLAGTLNKAEQATGKIGGTMTKWVTGPILAVAGGVTALITKTAKYGDEIQKMALRTGFSTEALSEYKHAAELSGSSLETVEKGVKRMQAVLLDAEQGLSTATDSLAALGLSYEELAGLSPEEQFDKIAMAIAGVEDPSRRAALAQEVFGRAGTELLPMLSDGAEGLAKMKQEAHDLGLVIDQEAADAAAQFNDDLDRLKKGFGGVFQELGQKLLPIIVDKLLPALKEKVIPAVQNFGEWIGKVIDWFDNLDPAWQKIIGGAIGLAAAIGPLLIAVSKFIGIIKTIIGLKQAWAVVQGILNAVMSANPIALIIIGIMALIAAVILCIKYWDEIVEFLGKCWDWIKETAVSVWESIVEFFLETWEWIKDLFNKALQAIIDAFIEYHPIGIIISHWTEIKEFFVNIWNTIVDYITGRVNAIKDKLSAAWEFISSVASDAWGAFSETILGTWEGIVDGIKGFVNKIIDAVNGMIEGMNKLKFNIPDWDIFGKLAGKKFGLNIPLIPRLAEGGLITRAGAVLVGERGPEVLDLPEGATVTPLSGTQGGRHEETNFNGPISLNVDIRKLKDVDDLIDLFKGLKQEAIARGMA